MLKYGGIMLVGWCVCLTACLHREPSVDYNADVKPILNKHCISCHGGVKQNGGFSLLTREEALAATDAGQPAIKPGNVRSSEMIRRLHAEDPEVRMPLDNDPLSDEEIDILTRWIDEGVAWDLHWSYKPLEQVEPPVQEVLGTVDPDAAMVLEGLDLFVADKLKEVGVSQLSPEADPAILMRRVSLDLIGMPAPDSIASIYLQDPGPDTYTEYVDALLQLPAYGEKWTSMWLDLARYADSKGFERDPHRDIWRYRDWLIRAFNADMPYDQFIIEQLAGDLLPDPSDDQLLATAFHRNTPTNDEGGTDNEEFRTYAVIDRVNTTWEGLMGTTFACVQCHSHPYDPFLQEEYYQFLAFFNNTRDADSAPDYPLLRHFAGEDSVQLNELLQWAGQQVSDDEVEAIETFIKTWQPAWYSLETDSFTQAELYDTKYLGMRQRGTCRLPQVSLTDKDALYVRYRTGLAGGKWEITAGQEQQKIMTTSLQPTDGWKIIRLSLEEVPEGTHDLYFTYENPNLADPDQPGVMFDWFRFTEKSELWELPDGDQYEKIYWDLLDKRLPTTPVMIENPPSMRRETHVFDRGNWLVKGKEVQPGVPHILPGLTTEDTPDRLDLAHWLVGEDHPLTARTLVNRLWAQLFGTGLVETLEDLGSQSPAPSHPELLDWLAWELIHTHDWQIKSFLKMIVMSKTYRQQSFASDALLEKDPYNRLLSRGPRVRLSAEQLRDQALYVSQLLNPEMYGPSVMPYQPIQWTTPYSNEKWVQSTDGQQYRRAVYTYWKRSNPYPAMMIFDAAAREICEARRIQTNTPLHALVTLNDPVYVEAASHFALRMCTAGDDLDSRIAAGYEWCLGVPVSPEKTAVFKDLYQQTQASFAEGNSDPAALLTHLDEGDEDLAAMVVVANAMMNMDEFITKN